MSTIKHTLVYTEQIELTLKAVFLLQIFYKLPSQTMDTSGDFDWMNREQNLPNSYYTRDEERSLDQAWYELRDNHLIESYDVCDGCYFKYRVSKKGEAIKDRIKEIDTKMYKYLIPVNFFKDIK